MHDDLDDLIDGALSTYSSAEPLSGLEQRVLNGVRAAERSRKRRWWWAALALAAPAVAAILFLTPARKPTPVPVAVTTPPRAHVEPAGPAEPRPAPAVRTRRTGRPRVLPRKPTFPTPSPLTREERLLVELAASRPQLLMARPMDEIEIKPLEIAPLITDGNH